MTDSPTSTDHEPLTSDEILTFRQLIKLTGIRKLYLTGEEIRAILPNQDKIQNFNEGTLAFNSGEIQIKHPTKIRSYITILLDEAYPSPDKSTSYQDHVNRHFTKIFDLLNRLFGFDWIIAKFVDQLDRLYDALSPGQAEAVLKKFIIRARDNDAAMSSTTRSQLHKLRMKIEKYKPLVDTFEPLLLSNFESLAALAEKMPRRFQFGEGPVRFEGGIVGTDRTIFEPVVSGIQGDIPLEHAPESTDHSSKQEIMELRERIREQGLDPDWEPPAVDGNEQVEVIEGLYFVCDWCDHIEPYELDDNGRIMPKMHHGRPMFLKQPRRQSDY